MAEQLHQTHLLSEYLEGELSMMQRQDVEAHLQTCTVCRQELRLLHCIRDVLQQLPPAAPSSDFVKNLHRRIDRQEKQCKAQEKGPLPHPTDQRPASETAPFAPAAIVSPMGVLWRKASSFGRMLRFPPQAKIFLYACAVLLGLSIVFFRAASEKPLLAPPQPELQVTPLPVQQVAPVADTPIQPVDVTAPTPTQPLLLDSPLPSTPGKIGETQPLRWRIVSNEPAALRRQVKELAGRIEGSAIVQEREDRLLISLPIQELGVFREKLAKLGTAGHPEHEPLPDTSTILLSLTFIREPSVATPSPLTPKRFEGGS